MKWKIARKRSASASGKYKSGSHSRFSENCKLIFNRDIIHTLLSRILILGLAFLATVITVRFLGIEGRGFYFYILTVANVITQICLLGLQSSNTYFIAKQPELLRPLLINSIWVSIGLTGFAAFVTIGFFSSYSLFWIIFLAPNLVFYLLASNLLIGAGRISTFNTLQIIGNFLIGGLLLIAGIFLPTTSAMLIALITARTVTSILMTVFLLNRSYPASWQFDFRLFKSGFGFSAKAYLSTLMANLILFAGVFFIKHLLNISQVGYYSIASQMFDTMAILPTTIATILFPKLIKLDQDRWQHAKDNLKMTGFIMLLLCLLAALLTKPFIILAFGREYLPAADIFYWMLPAAFFYALISIVSQYLSATGFPMMQVMVWFIGFFLVAAGNFLLIPVFNINGSAMALSLTYGILLLLFLRQAKKLAAGFNNLATDQI